MAKLVLPPQYSKRILRVSALTLVSISSAIYNELPFNCGLAATVMFTSVNYWRHPTFGLRRNVDIVCACGALGYQALFTAYDTTPAGRCAYWLAVAAGGCCYLLAFYNGRFLGNLNRASKLHVGVHLFGNLGNVMLYDSLGANLLGLGAGLQRAQASSG